MGIFNFASEIFLMVAENLSIGDLSNFRLTSQRLHSVLTPLFEELCLQDIGELTALQWAVFRGHDGLIKLAIPRGAEIDKPIRRKLNSTDLAISGKRNLDPMCFWANNGAATSDKDAILRTSLYLAACLGRQKAIELLLKAGASMQCFGEMNTPAHVSARRGDIDCMQAFINAKVDISIRGFHGRSILHAATESDGVEMMIYLLELAGGEKLVNARGCHQDTPLHRAASACRLGEQSSVKIELLLQHGADICARDEFGNTPAHTAAAMGNVFAMRALIAAGIDWDARNNSGDTILHSAINGEQGMLEYLLGQKGGRKIIDVVDNEGHTPLYTAVLLREREAAEQLVEYGANKRGLSALKYVQEPAGDKPGWETRIISSRGGGRVGLARVFSRWLERARGN